jgi:hypothetical protein
MQRKSRLSQTRALQRFEGLDKVKVHGAESLGLGAEAERKS